MNIVTLRQSNERLRFLPASGLRTDPDDIRAHDDAQFAIEWRSNRLLWREPLNQRHPRFRDCAEFEPRHAGVVLYGSGKNDQQALPKNRGDPVKSIANAREKSLLL